MNAAGHNLFVIRITKQTAAPRRRMKQGVDEVRAGRAVAEDAAVGHVRQPGEGKPVAGVQGGECPFDAGERQAVLHHGIVGDVVIVIIGPSNRDPPPAGRGPRL